MNNNAIFNNHASFNNFDQASNPNFLDSSTSYNSISPSNLDLSQFQAPQAHSQRSGDGVVRNQTPGFQQSTYQVNPSIPAKRPRPGEDTVGASPRSAPGNSNASRSQTPQQGPYSNAFAGQQQHGQPFQPPTPYQHLQNSSSNHASPSPTMQNQQYRPPGSQPPRLQNSSPQGMPANVTNFASQQQMQNNMSRMATPQNMQNQRFVQNFNPNAMGNPGMMPPNMSTPMQSQHPSAQSNNPGMLDAQRQYQMQYPPNFQNSGSGPNSMPRPPTNMGESTFGNWQQQRQNGQGPGPGPGTDPSTGRVMNQQFSQNPTQAQHADVQKLYQSIQSNLNKYLQDFNETLDPDPRIAGNKIQWTKLFVNVARVQPMNPANAQKGGWAMVAKTMGIDPTQHPTAPQESKDLFDKNLEGFYKHYISNMRQKREQMRSGVGNQMQGSPTAIGQTAVQPPQPPFSQNDGPQQSQQPGSSQGISSASPEQNDMHRTSANGLATPQQQNIQQHPSSTPQSHQKTGPNQTAPSEAKQSQQMFSQTPPRPTSQQSSLAKPASAAQDEHIGSVQSPPTTEYKPGHWPLKDSYGGCRLDAHMEHGLQHTTRSVTGLQFAIAAQDLRDVDILSITKMLQSGFVHETSAALDQLTILISREEQPGYEQHRVNVGHCEELLDALVDCAEAQLELLVEKAPIASEKLCVQSFDSIFKLAVSEDNTIKHRNHVADGEYDKDHAAERVLAVTAILRNLSYNHFDLEGKRVPCANPTVISFLCDALRLLGSRKLLLRSGRNTLDFMKDVVIFLSNTALGISLSNEDDARIIVQFLVAFSPMQPTEGDCKVPLQFIPYHPTKHQYLPPAVDALAKLLARDQPEQPNRAYMKAVFLSDQSPRPCDLLTRTFALSIAPIPDHSKFPADAFAMASHGSRAPAKRDEGVIVVADRRKAFFSQGMLAADILASLAPGSESGPARPWLESRDGWAPNLLRLVLRLTDEQTDFYTRRPMGRDSIQEHSGSDFGMIILQSLSMLQRLVEKVEVNEHGARFDTSGWPPLEDMMAELLGNNRFPPKVLKQLSGLSRLLR